MVDRKRKGKAVATSSNQASPRFKTLYHEAHFNSMFSARRILPELILQADEDVFNPIRYQIYNRKWEKFTKSIQAVSHLMVKEFYANAWESDKAKRKHPTYTSTRQFKEMEMQGIPVTMANLAIHRQREEANKGKAREIVPDSEDSEDTFVSGESEEI
ncbi:hypothetical protein PIB30_096231 [Stylosanthes scabra]|uniref:Uncharacterized protein n=1 Tax=Stylosanthes scabra TaxID=79078 RepID=A0ABU6UUS3_9FABA|nr:hypothetical protein [Stylosanthes scabra]